MSPGDQTVVLVNPSAGGGRCGRRFEAAPARLNAMGLKPLVVASNAPGDLTRQARSYFERGHRRFLAVGGDGSFFEVLNGLFPEALAERPTVGILPLGTGNSFLRDFQIQNADDAFNALRENRTRPVDIVRLDHDGGSLFWANICSVGFSAHVGRLTNRHFKFLGGGAYIAAVLFGLLGLRHPVFPIQIDAGEWDKRPSCMIAFCNSKFTGGDMMMAPPAQTDDGRLDIIRFGGLSRFRLLTSFRRIFDGSHLQLPEVTSTTAGKVTFDLNEPVDTLVDGEVVRIRPRMLEVLPHALELWV